MKMTRMTELNMVLLDKSGGLVYNDDTYPKPRPAEGRVYRKEGSSMEALKNLVMDGEFVTFFVYGGGSLAVVFVVCVLGAFQTLSKRPRRRLAASIIGSLIVFALGAIAMYFWLKV